MSIVLAHSGSYTKYTQQWAIDEGKDFTWVDHNCEGLEGASYDTYGPAVESISYYGDSGSWGMGNGEYGTHPIYYCPFCGIKLENPFPSLTRGSVD